MKRIEWWHLALLTTTGVLSPEVTFAQSLTVVYPPANHKTTSESIFIIGSANSSGNVTINGQTISRSNQGHFAPSIPLKMGKNQVTIRYGQQTLTRNITRISNQAKVSDINSFATSLMFPNQNLSRLPGELICFTTTAPKQAKTIVKVGNQTINLKPQVANANLPANSAILIAQNQPQSSQVGEKVAGCTSFSQPINNLQPQWEMTLQNKTISQRTPAQINILDPQKLFVVQVTADSGVARTGASTTYSRLTPLPKGTIATVTGEEGAWWRLDYGGWIKKSETKVLPNNSPTTSFIRSVTSRQVNDRTEIILPVTSPVPITIQQEDDRFTLSLHNTIAQTDTIRLDDNPVIKRLDWYQNTATRIDYVFHFKSSQQWGYDVRYEGNSLILTFNHPPKVSNSQDLRGVTVLLDPGHGGKESGALGSNGYPEKSVNLVVSKLLAKQLEQRGAKVYLTRETDKFVSLGDRQKMIDNLKPTVAFSIHYNALPDGGDAERTKGISMFWYNPQSHDLAIFMQDYLVNKLNRESYGVFWNNLALTRPHTTPLVLLELGFMINPEEFEWIINPQDQEKLALTIADGIGEWLALKSQ